MSDRELTEAQLAAQKARLEQLRGDLEALLFTDDTQAVELDQSRQGRLSRMDAMQQQAMAKAKRQAFQGQLRQVLAALRRLDEDDYGYCLDCDEPIPLARLKVRPEAELCLACQSRADL
mgnify:CR=1 FL=1